MHRLSKDELYLLESIATDATKSADERAEARARLDTELEMRLGFGMAQMFGTLASLARPVQDCVDAIVSLDETLQGLVDSGMDAMSREERAEVLRLVRAGECQLDAMVIVEERHAPASESSAS